MMKSINASIGNLNASGDNSKKESVFNDLLYINAWFYGLTSVALFILLKELIRVWLGNGFDIGFGAVFAACASYYISGMHYPCFTFRTTSGLFAYAKYVPFLAVVVNVVLGILLGINFGITGILLSVIISRLSTYEIIDPILIYRHIFLKNVSVYFIRYGAYLSLTMLGGGVSYMVTQLFTVEGFIGVLVKIVLICVIYSTVFILATLKTQSFLAIRDRIEVLLMNKNLGNIKC